MINLSNFYKKEPIPEIGEVVYLGTSEVLVNLSGLEYLKSGYLVESTNESETSDISRTVWKSSSGTSIVDCFNLNDKSITIFIDGMVSDGKNKWQMSLPDFTGKMNIESVKIGKDNHIILICTDANNRQNGFFVYKSTDLGKVWSKVSIPEVTGESETQSLWIEIETNKKGKWIITHYYKDSKPLVSTDNGVTWQEVENLPLSGTGVYYYMTYHGNGVWSTSRNTTASRGLFISTDDGATWVQRFSDNIIKNKNGESWIDSNQILFTASLYANGRLYVCIGNASNSKVSGIIYSDDYGETWDWNPSTFRITSGNFRSSFFVSHNNTIYFSSTDGSVYFSLDGLIFERQEDIFPVGQFRKFVHIGWDSSNSEVGEKRGLYLTNKQQSTILNYYLTMVLGDKEYEEFKYVRIK